MYTILYRQGTALIAPMARSLMLHFGVGRICCICRVHRCPPWRSPWHSVGSKAHLAACDKNHTSTPTSKTSRAACCCTAFTSDGGSDKGDEDEGGLSCRSIKASTAAQIRCMNGARVATADSAVGSAVVEDVFDSLYYEALAHRWLARTLEGIGVSQYHITVLGC